MATTEERVDKLEVRFATLEQQFAATMAKADSIVSELKEQREDIRRAQEKHDADIKEIRIEIRDALKNIQGLIIASMIGIATIVIAVLLK